MQTFSRRDVLRLLGVGALAGTGAPLTSTATPSKCPRPNILFIMADDHAKHGLSCYGSPILSTPHIDQLASQGMRFTQAMGVNSLCAPARAALITGKHSHINGKRTNGDPFNGRQQSFPKLLQSAGYETAIVGKWHLKVEPPGFDFYKVMRAHGNYFDSEFRETGKGWHTEKGYLTNVITDSAIDWLKQRKDDKPFCLMVHHKAPHGPDIHEERHKQLFKDETIPEPETLDDDWETREALQNLEASSSKLINMHWRQDIYRKLMASAPTEKKARTRAVYQQMIKGYMRLVASLDENVGRLLDYIDDAGLRENTMVVYTSDNGFFLGDHGLYNKMWMYKESMNIPLLVRFPGVVKVGTVNEDMVSMLDFAPTFLDMAGAPIPADLQGRSFVPLLEGECPDDWREVVYYHFYSAGGLERAVEHYGIRTKTHKLIHFPKFAEGDYWELYDLAEDANELTNVYGNSAYQDIQNDLHAMLTARRNELKAPQT